MEALYIYWYYIPNCSYCAQFNDWIWSFFGNGGGIVTTIGGFFGF